MTQEPRSDLGRRVRLTEACLKKGHSIDGNAKRELDTCTELVFTDLFATRR